MTYYRDCVGLTIVDLTFMEMREPLIYVAMGMIWLRI